MAQRMHVRIVVFKIKLIFDVPTFDIKIKLIRIFNVNSFYFVV